MKAETMYKDIVTLIRSYGAANHTEDVARKVIEHPHCNIQPDDLFYATASTLLLATMETMDKSGGRSSMVMALKRIIANGTKHGPAITHGVFVDSSKDMKNPWYCVTDGCRLIRLKADVPSLPHITDTQDTSVWMPKQLGDEIELPTTLEVKRYIAEFGAGYAGKAKDKVNHATPYCLRLGKREWYCNPYYLLDMIQVLPGCKGYIPAERTAPMLFQADAGDGLLLPTKPEAVVKKEEK